MKRVIGWFGSMFGRRADTAMENQPDGPELEIDIPSRAKVEAWMDGREPGQDDYAATVPELENLDIHLPDHDKPAGSEP